MTTPGQLGTAPGVLQGERRPGAGAGRRAFARAGSHAVGQQEGSGRR